MKKPVRKISMMSRVNVNIIVLIIGLFAEISFVNSAFDCKNGNHINKDICFCNGVDDCGDFSDEFYGCDREFCGKGKFRCENFQCLPIASRCDGIKDCSDGSDEMHCDKDLSFENCTMHEGKFLCKDGSQCIHLSLVCNDFEDCSDSSDENVNCSRYDKDLCDSCPHPCFRTPNGPQCFCDPGNEFHGQCKKIAECSNYNSTCTQKCVKYEDTEQCSCNKNYKIEYGTLCLTDLPLENAMVYSTTNEIKSLNLTTKELKIVKRGVHARALTAVKNSVFWSDNTGSIFSKLVDDENERIIRTGLNVTTSIAVDWISGNVYFTSQKVLSVCNEGGEICVKLKHSIFDIESVALAPTHGLMFWAIDPKANNKYIIPCILRSYMDGSHEMVFVDKMLRAPTSLSVDEAFEKLYWFDTKSGKVESIKFDGKDRHVSVFHASDILSFTVLEESRYWSHNLKNAIYAATYDFKGTLFMDRDSSSVGFLHAYKPIVQEPQKISNPCDPCSGLCLLRPGLSRGLLNSTCLCENYKLRISDHSHWCHDKPTYQIFDQRNHSYETNDEFPSENGFQFLSNTVVFFIVLVVIINALLSAALYFGCEKWKKKKLCGSSITLKGIIDSYNKE